MSGIMDRFGHVHPCAWIISQSSGDNRWPVEVVTASREAAEQRVQALREAASRLEAVARDMWDHINGSWLSDHEPPPGSVMDNPEGHDAWHAEYTAELVRFLDSRGVPPDERELVFTAEIDSAEPSRPVFSIQEVPLWPGPENPCATIS